MHRPPHSHFLILRSPYHPWFLPKMLTRSSLWYLIPKLALAPHRVTQAQWGCQGQGQVMVTKPVRAQAWLGRAGCFATPHTRFGTESERLQDSYNPRAESEACLPHPESPEQTYPPASAPHPCQLLIPLDKVWISCQMRKGHGGQ